ncbi:MAG: M48 family metalloprotease [Micromonosporaceae bacterium]|nr:M48 family metalloprotease [Micromonosporaceae bacterium]
MFCDQCGRQIPATAGVCPHCGARLEPIPPALVLPPAPIIIPVPPAPAPPVPIPPPVAAPLPGQIAQGAGWRAYRSAIGRNWAGTAAGIFGAWFNAPFVVLCAGIGVFFGGLAGVVNGTFAGAGVLKRLDALITWVFPLPYHAEDLLPTAGAQVGGIVGGILGAINGGWKLAWAAWSWPWERLYSDDPTWPATVAIGQIVTALVVAVLYLCWSTVTEGWRLRVSGARRPSRRESEWIMPIVLEAAGRLGLTRLPRILIDDRREPNAHAGIRHMVINYGLLDQLQYDRNKVAGIVAHELVHWRDGDAIAMVWARGVALPLVLAYNLGAKMLSWQRVRPLHMVIRFLFWSVFVVVQRFVLPVQARYWRRLEYRADRLAAEAGYRDGLRGALVYLRTSFDGERSGWDAAILATHPPNELRLEHLEAPGRRYPLRDDHPLASSGLTPDSTVRKGW